jgi:hypothetical protein
LRWPNLSFPISDHLEVSIDATQGRVGMEAASP